MHVHFVMEQRKYESMQKATTLKTKNSKIVDITLHVGIFITVFK